MSTCLSSFFRLRQFVFCSHCNVGWFFLNDGETFLFDIPCASLRVGMLKPEKCLKRPHSQQSNLSWFFISRSWFVLYKNKRHIHVKDFCSICGDGQFECTKNRTQLGLLNDNFYVTLRLAENDFLFCRVQYSISPTAFEKQIYMLQKYSFSSFEQK